VNVIQIGFRIRWIDLFLADDVWRLRIVAYPVWLIDHLIISKTRDIWLKLTLLRLRLHIFLKHIWINNKRFLIVCIQANLITVINITWIDLDWSIIWNPLIKVELINIWIKCWWYLVSARSLNVWMCTRTKRVVVGFIFSTNVVEVRLRSSFSHLNALFRISSLFVDKGLKS
jgi:hypothetical protein